MEWLNLPHFPLLAASKDLNSSSIPPVADLPDIAVIWIESWSPAPYYISSNIMRAAPDQQVVEGPMFVEELDNFRKFSTKSLNFYALRSLGVPSLNGWGGFVNGEQPGPHNINSIRSQFNHLDDLPSYLKSFGYHN